MSGFELQLLGYRIRKCGFAVRTFHYSSLRMSPAENAAVLNDFIISLDTEVVHLVAHSLGGIVITHLFDQFPQQPPGKVLMLGTPLRGSATAAALDRYHLANFTLGRSKEGGLLGDRPGWHGGRELAMIAGDRGLGIGQLIFRKLPQPNDGMVALEETSTAEVTQHKRVPYSHVGLVLSKRVGNAVCSYLKTGELR